ncbi:Hypothetical protein EHI5A_208040 [Entamoeba histolytica KU27]|uniref:Leucinerich repeat-containing protein n=1 Tax=Entamoeba histolytica KU27 TaxID=885311 RepID=M2RF70_ENTHI|nr:Hypothetical protein EHI5A_208040 [Entamoeba histolytica KU27]
MNKVQLEKVYLANVILYADSLETVKKFIQINKKCDDVRKMIRKAPNLFRKTINREEYCFNKWDGIFIMKRTINEYLAQIAREVFPNINTLILEGGEVPRYISQLDSIDRITLYDPPFDLTLMEKIEDCIVEFIWNYSPVSLVNIGKMKLLKRCKIDIGRQKFDINSVFSNKQQHLKILRLSNIGNYKEIEEFKEYKNIERVIIEIDDDTKEEYIEQMSKYAVLVSDQWYSQLNKNVIVMMDKKFHLQIKEKPNVETLEFIQQNYLPYKMIIDADYYDGIQTQFKLFDNVMKLTLNVEIDPQEEVDQDDIMQRRMDRINGIERSDDDDFVEETEEQKEERERLHKLEIERRKHSIILPQHLTSITINDMTPYFHQTLSITLKELTTSNIPIDFIYQLTSLTKINISNTNITQSLKSLEKLIDITFNLCVDECSEFICPHSVECLKLYNCRNWKFQELSHLKLLDKLMIYDARPNVLSTLQLNEATSVKKLYLNNVITASMPTSLTCLIIGSAGNKAIDMTKYLQLKDVCIENSNQVRVKLPLSIKSLYLYCSSIRIFNKNDIQLKELHLEDCEDINFESFNLNHVTKLSLLPFDEEYLEYLEQFPVLEEKNFN